MNSDNSGLSRYFATDDDDIFENIAQSPTAETKINPETQKIATNESAKLTPIKPKEETRNWKMANSNPLPNPSKFFDNIGPSGNLSLTDTDVAFSENLRSNINLSSDNIGSPDGQYTNTEGDRRFDAWIPTEDAKKVLIQAQISSAGSFFPERSVLTMPGVILEKDLGDVLHNVVAHYLGEAEATQRGSLGCEHVSQDERGLRELIQAGCFRSAINLTTRLLTIYGQGVGRSGHPSKHSPRSLQLWFTRLALLVKINSYSLAENEADAFGSLDNPDMYFQFYPDMYPNRSGSMASFSFRLLLAELPMHGGEYENCMERLHRLLAVIRKVISNLRANKAEDGSDIKMSPQDRQESVKLWSNREARVQFSVVNCALQMKDFALAIQILEDIAKNPAWPPSHTRSLYSAIGRSCLQAGHVLGAEEYFKKATEIRMTLSPESDVRELVDKALLAVSQNSFEEAHQLLLKAKDLEPGNIMVLNNMAVCLLYLGQLKDAIEVMENALNANPNRGLCESLLLNLCTLYELESSNTMTKKLALLRQLCRFKSDTVNNVPTCLKLHV